MAFSPIAPSAGPTREEVFARTSAAVQELTDREFLHLFDTETSRRFLLRTAVTDPGSSNPDVLLRATE